MPRRQGRRWNLWTKMTRERGASEPGQQAGQPGDPTGFYSEANLGFLEAVEPINEASVEKVPESGVPLETVQCEPMVPARELHHHDLLGAHSRVGCGLRESHAAP